MGPITKGQDFNFFTKVVVTGISFPVQSQVSFNFKGQTSFSLVNEGNTVVEYSFNGTTLHGDLTPNSPTESIIFNSRRVPAIWFRTGGSCLIRIEAWTRA